MESLLSLLRPQSIRIKKQSKLVQDYMNIVTTFIHYVLIYIRQTISFLFRFMQGRSQDWKLGGRSTNKQTKKFKTSNKHSFDKPSTNKNTQN